MAKKKLSESHPESYRELVKLVEYYGLEAIKGAVDSIEWNMTASRLRREIAANKLEVADA